MEKIKVLLVDDHRMVINGIVKLLENEQEIEVVKTLQNPEKLEEYIPAHQIDVLIIDIRMKQYNGLKLTREIKKQYTDVKVVILSGYNLEEYQRAAFESGASAFVSKENSVNELANAIKNANSGNLLFSSKVINEYSSKDRLTAKELKVLTLISKDKSNLEISLEMKISKRTVEHHVSIIIQKLNCSSRVGAVVEGLKSGLITA
ncbi:response regulator [Alteribacillus sp. HJP-4]|uniref:response regulator n=1 Tax=Alteribacillus sp. HJP-4 TaxID=2775394 RepID=UPI0035CD226D